MTPGEAWNAADTALKAGDIAKAEELLPLLYKTDRALMRERIEKAKETK